MANITQFFEFATSNEVVGEGRGGVKPRNQVLDSCPFSKSKTFTTFIFILF